MTLNSLSMFANFTTSMLSRIPQLAAASGGIQAPMLLLVYDVSISPTGYPRVWYRYFPYNQHKAEKFSSVPTVSVKTQKNEV